MVDTQTITVDRLKRWTKRLENEHATPILLLGVGHDDNCGQLVLCTCEQVSNSELRQFLRYALRELETCD